MRYACVVFIYPNGASQVSILDQNDPRQRLNPKRTTGVVIGQADSVGELQYCMSNWINLYHQALGIG